jgi:circadian clock protein KaiB
MKKSELDEFEDAMRKAGNGVYVLKLYITGMTPNSQRAVENVKKICEEHLKGRYELEIVDIYQQPQLAQEAQLIAVPTLVKSLPLPLRKLIGDMSDKEKILIGLNLKER